MSSGEISAFVVLLRGGLPNARIGEMLADGVLDQDEQRELLRILAEFLDTREQARIASETPLDLSRPLDKVTVDSPYDDPEPDVEHMGRTFVVTGDFIVAKRNDVISTIERLGGTVATSVSKKVNFVVVGSRGSELWSGGNYGTKIERAVELRGAGVPVRIVSERKWHACVQARA